MRIDTASYAGVHATRRRTPAGGGASFAPTGSGGGATARAGLQGSAPATGIEALLALQGLEPPDPRERGLARGRQMLDLLDELRLALLEGGDGGARLDRLAALVHEDGESTGHPGLDSLVAQIDLRARVELAKRGR